MTTLLIADGTLDEFIARRMAETAHIDWDSDDAGGLFGIIFSGFDEFQEDEAEALFQQGIEYFMNKKQQ